MTFITGARIRVGVLGVVLVCSSVALGWAPSARADAIYTYTGMPLTNFAGGDSCTGGVGECFVSGSITFASALPSDSVFSLSEDFEAFGGPQVLPPNLLSFFITDGVQTLANTDVGRYGSPAFGITLDIGSNGQIISWSYFIADDPETGIGTGSPGHGFGPGGAAGGDLTTRFSGGKAYNSGTPGTWTVTETPEASSFILLGAGFLGMAGVWRWKARAKL